MLRPYARWFIASSLCLNLAILPAWLTTETDPWASLKRLNFIIAVITLTRLLGVKRQPKVGRFILPLTVLFLLILITLISSTSSIRAWTAVTISFSLGLLLTQHISGLFSLTRTPLRFVTIFLLWLFVGGAIGLGLAVILGLTSRFAEEEFFSLAIGIYISLMWLTIGLAYNIIYPKQVRYLQTKLNLRQKIIISSTLLFVSIGAIFWFLPWLAQQYQRSFYPLLTPPYAGLSEEQPFLCETLLTSSQPLPAQQIYPNLINLLKAAPFTTTLTQGSLALYTNEEEHAQAYRQNLLKEAKMGLFTTPAQSIKWGQYEAALRLHQFKLLEPSFPNLFSKTDRAVLKAWFAQINQRTQTTEWVDLLYALAYGKHPAGPYENQEIGAGLLAILETTDFSAPDLRVQNKAYLKTRPLGWHQLFRNTDDAYTYQGVWLSNAWWIHQYQQQLDPPPGQVKQNISHAFSWLTAQALPDGEALSYNIHYTPNMTEYFLMGAALLKDPSMTWLAIKSLNRLTAQGQHLNGRFPWPRSQLVDGVAPDIGSCLLYGNSGVPTTKGPLAPDKIVLRDGWQDDALYALLNLRFSGWHRYKAANTLTLLYQDGPLVSEKWHSGKLGWLPEGRRALRDKRVPRENLNGLQLPKSGLSRVLWLLSGIGSPWHQDPPAYTEVEYFFATDWVDSTKTTLSNWHHWQHERTLYLIHPGIIVVVDQAKTDTGPSPAAIIWHLNGRGQMGPHGIQLDNEHRSAQLIWSQGAAPNIKLTAVEPTDIFLRRPNWTLQYTSPEDKTLHFATAFLAGEAAQGEVQLTFDNTYQGLTLTWQRGTKRKTLLHNNSGHYLSQAALATDGAAIILLEDTNENQVQLCHIGGQNFQATLSRQPKQIFTSKKEELPAHITWQVEQKTISITSSNKLTPDCFILIGSP